MSELLTNDKELSQMVMDVMDPIDFESFDLNFYFNPMNEALDPNNNFNNNFNNNLNNYYNNNNSTQYLTQCPNNSFNSYESQPFNHNSNYNFNNYNNNNSINSSIEYNNYGQNGLFGKRNAFNNEIQYYGNNYQLDYNIENEVNNEVNNGLINSENTSQTNDVSMSPTLNGLLMSSQEFIQQNISELQSIQSTQTVNQINDKTQQIVNQTNNSEKVVNKGSNDKKEEKSAKVQIAVKGLLKLSKSDNREKLIRVRVIDRKTIESKLRLKRERNRIAAKKCREKKLELIRSLENRKNVLIQETLQLENELTKRRTEIVETKLFILNHRFNNCKLNK